MLPTLKQVELSHQTVIITVEPLIDTFIDFKVKQFVKLVFNQSNHI